MNPSNSANDVGEKLILGSQWDGKRDYKNIMPSIPSKVATASAGSTLKLYCFWTRLTSQRTAYASHHLKSPLVASGCMKRSDHVLIPLSNETFMIALGKVRTGRSRMAVSDMITFGIREEYHELVPIREEYVLELESAPHARIGAAAATIARLKKTYLWGGRSACDTDHMETSNPYNDIITANSPSALGELPGNNSYYVWELDHNTRTWTLVPTLPGEIPGQKVVPNLRFGHSMTSNKVDRVYLHAGAGRGDGMDCFDDLWVLHLNPPRWQIINSTPRLMCRGTSIAFSEYDGRLYRYGGERCVRDPDRFFAMEGALEYCYAEAARPQWHSAWEARQTADMTSRPQDRSHAALLSVDFKDSDQKSRHLLVTMFGRSSRNDQNQDVHELFRDMWAWDIVGQEWIKVEQRETGRDGELPVARDRFAAVVLGDGRILLHGGMGRRRPLGGLNWVPELLDDVWIGQLAFLSE
jgi:hypothetical protein